MFKNIKEFFKKYFQIGPIIVNPFNRRSIGMKFTFKNRDERREQKIREIIADAFDLKIEYIFEDDLIKENYDADSLDVIELMMDLEEEILKSFCMHFVT